MTLFPLRPLTHVRPSIDDYYGLGAESPVEVITSHSQLSPHRPSRSVAIIAVFLRLLVMNSTLA